ncbi:hypothetical protein [Streptomyces sp. NPDC005533]|uniref:hypothetical protein n=1 Tax=Streptomyces sp. NPDC005533 TaxID=3364723 RepID=UPI0036B2A15F
MQEPTQFALGGDAAGFRVALFGRASSSLLLHGEDHGLTSTLQGPEGDAPRFRHHRFGGLNGLGQLR